jgi:hypothetical protein
MPSRSITLVTHLSLHFSLELHLMHVLNVEWPPLFDASDRGSCVEVSSLIQRGVDVNWQDHISPLPPPLFLSSCLFT